MKKYIAMLVMVLATVSTVRSEMAAFKFDDGFDGIGTVTQVSPTNDSIKSCGDNNRVVEVKSPHYHSANKEYGYLFLDSKVFLLVGVGARPVPLGENTLAVSSIEVVFNGRNTEILSVSWSDKRDAYLLTFREDGRMRTEWINLNSDVFLDVLSRQIGEEVKSAVDRTTGFKYFDSSMMMR